MEPYAGPSLADFKYTDCQGVLTGWLYGNETKEAWEDNWPTFHLEVKSTSGGEGEPFHMSKAQIDYVSDVHELPSDGAHSDIGIPICYPRFHECPRRVIRNHPSVGHSSVPDIYNISGSSPSLLRRTIAH